MLATDTKIIIAIDLEKQRQSILSHYSKAARELAEIGRLLLEAQESLGDETSFLAFVTTLPFGRRSAYNFIRIHQHALRHGDAILAIEQIRISAWYLIPPKNNEIVQAVLEKAARGEEVTKKEVKMLISSAKFEDERKEQAWHEAAQISTPYVLNAIKTGVVTDALTGDDMPLEEADATLVLVGAEQDKWERVARNASPVQPLHSPHSLTVMLERIQDNQGRWRLALPENVPAFLIGKKITIYVENEAAA
jgi:hypothetical protein